MPYSSWRQKAAVYMRRGGGGFRRHIYREIQREREVEEIVKGEKPMKPKDLLEDLEKDKNMERLNEVVMEADTMSLLYTPITQQAAINYVLAGQQSLAASLSSAQMHPFSNAGITRR